MSRFLDQLFGRRDCNRATLTFLRDGQIILGLPPDTSQKEAYEVAKGIQEWNETGQVGLAVVPFPVDVIDLRPR